MLLRGENEPNSSVSAWGFFGIRVVAGSEKIFLSGRSFVASALGFDVLEKSGACFEDLMTISISDGSQLFARSIATYLFAV